MRSRFMTAEELEEEIQQVREKEHDALVQWRKDTDKRLKKIEQTVAKLSTKASNKLTRRNTVRKSTK